MLQLDLLMFTMSVVQGEKHNQEMITRVRLIAAQLPAIACA